MTGEVGVGLLEFGVYGSTAAALLLKLLTKLSRALDQLVVFVGPLALDRVNDGGLLFAVGQMDPQHLAVAALSAQPFHHPRRCACGLRRRREQAHGLLQVVGPEAAQMAPRID